MYEVPVHKNIHLNLYIFLSLNRTSTNGKYTPERHILEMSGAGNIVLEGEKLELKEKNRIPD